MCDIFHNCFDEETRKIATEGIAKINEAMKNCPPMPTYEAQPVFTVGGVEYVVPNEAMTEEMEQIREIQDGKVDEEFVKNYGLEIYRIDLVDSKEDM